MAALGLDSKLDRAPELPDVPWPFSGAYAEAQVLAAGRYLKTNTIKANTIFQGLPSNKKKLRPSKEHRRHETEERWQLTRQISASKSFKDTYGIRDGR
jgi:hypothetical protein